MATLRKIADDLAYTLGFPHDDNLKEIIKFNVKNLRAVYIRRRIERDGDTGIYNQRMTVDLKKVDKADTCAGLVNCNVLRTVNKIPISLIVKSDTSPFKFIGNIDESVSYTYTELNELNGLMAINPKKNTIYYDYVNSYIYVFNIPLNRQKKLRIRGIFGEPDTVKDDCSDVSCFNELDIEFPIDQDLLVAIKEDIIKKGYIGLSKNEEIKIDGE